MHNIISKVLANCMSKVMEKLILKFIMLLLKGDMVLESVLIANECLKSILRMGVQGFYVSWI